MFENLRADYERHRRPGTAVGSKGASQALGMREILRITTINTVWPVIAYRFQRWSKQLRVPGIRHFAIILSILLQRWTSLWTGAYIHSEAVVGPGLLIENPGGVFIGPTRIGCNLTLSTGVLIAGGALGVGDYVTFGPGAKLIGDTRVGSYVTVMANSLVLSNLSDHVTVLGVPARRVEPEFSELSTGEHDDSRRVM